MIGTGLQTSFPNQKRIWALCLNSPQSSQPTLNVKLLQSYKNYCIKKIERSLELPSMQVLW